MHTEDFHSGAVDLTEEEHAIYLQLIQPNKHFHVGSIMDMAVRMEYLLPRVLMTSYQESLFLSHRILERTPSLKLTVMGQRFVAHHKQVTELLGCN